MSKIFYIGYYDTSGSLETRNYLLAATNKMTYIIFTLEKFYEKITVISHSGSRGKKSYPAQIKNLSPITKLSLLFTLGTGFILKRVLQRFILNIQLLYKLLFWIKKDDQVIVYHSLGYLALIALAKKIKKFRLILEVEEIYGDVLGSKKISEKELQFFSLADAYILPTELLNKKINIHNKPHAIIYETYQVEHSRKRLFNDGKIHCVYAGTFDPRKGGGMAAAEYLDDRYHMHILGFGSEKDTQHLHKIIDEVSKKQNVL